MVDQPSWWRRRGAMASVLWPLSLLFRAVTTLRRTAYRRGWLASYRAPVPVVVIGNITVGGSGKTPLVLALAKHLHEQGVACAVVSRGYGGSACGVSEVGKSSDPARVGDEPLLIRRRADVPVFAAAKRCDAVKAALVAYPHTQIILCDDGMQHYALERDMEVAVFAADLGMGNGWMLPAGPLREPPSRLRGIDAVIVTGDGASAQAASMGRGVFAAEPCSAGVCTLSAQKCITWNELTQYRHLYLITAIARPQRVVALLRAHGIALKQTCFFADHATLGDEAIALASVMAEDGWVVMTAKDAVKTDGWPTALREKVLVVDYRLALPADVASMVAGLIKNRQE